MTLGSALPWRACSPLCRIHPLAFSACRIAPRAVGHRDFLRAQSTDTRATPLSYSTYSLEEADAVETSPLIDRLRDLPVRPHGAWDPVVVKPVDQYPHKRETRNAHFRNRKEQAQQARIENRRYRPQPGDWRVVLQNLTKWTPTHTKQQDGIKVTIPKSSVELLLSDHKYSLWNIKSRARCRMTLHVAANDADEGIVRVEDKVRIEGKGRDKIGAGNPSGQEKQADADAYIIFSGQPTAITAAIDELLTVTKIVSVVNLSGGPHTVLHDGQANEEAIRGIAAHSSVTGISISHYQMSVPCKPYKISVRADEIPLPPTWTIETFQQYIAALAMGRCPGTLAAKLYTNRGTDTHQNTVVALLLGVFKDPAASVAVSSPAFKLALAYFVRSGETFVNEARELIDRVRSLGLPMDTEVYNLLAETSVKSKNLLAFETTIERMIQDGYKPDKRTWILFLRLIEAEEVRRYIMHSMHYKDFFEDRSVVQAVSAEMADQDIHRAIQQGQDVDAFLTGLRELYGSDWRLPPRSANRYLENLARYSKFDEMKKLLGYMLEGKHCKPNTLMLNTILRHCKEQRKVDLAVEFVRLFDKHGFHVADEQSIHYLFEMGRKIFKPHLLGAVWRYAHLVRLDSSVMRHRGRTFLDSGPQGAVKLLKLTDRIRQLWDGPEPCRITRSEFSTSLLLYDYQKAVGDPALVALDRLAEGQEAEGPRKLAVDPPRLRSPEQYPLFASAIASGEGNGSQNPTGTEPAATDPLEDSRPTRRTPSRKQKYDPYQKWVFERARDYKPAVGLGEFLQEALDRDRRLHRLAHTGEGVVKGGVPVDLVPPELPVVKVPRNEKKKTRMWNWEGVGGGRQLLRLGGEGEMGAMDEMDELDDTHEHGQVEELGGRGEVEKAEEKGKTEEVGKMDEMDVMDVMDVVEVMREMGEEGEKGEVVAAEVAGAGGKDARGGTAQPDEDLATKLIMELESEKKRTLEALFGQAARSADEDRMATQRQPEPSRKQEFEPLVIQRAPRANEGQVVIRRLKVGLQNKQASEQPTKQAFGQPTKQTIERPRTQVSEQSAKQHEDDLWDLGFVKGLTLLDDMSAAFSDVGDNRKRQRARGPARSRRTAEPAGKPRGAVKEGDVWDKLMNEGTKIQQEQRRAAGRMRASF